MDDTPKLPKGQSRGLTPGELEIARSVFGGSIDYSKVRIHNDTSNMFQSKDTTVTPNGEMYCGADSYSDDFSKGDVHRFVHEMTHIWQYQNNVLNPRIAAVKEEFKSGFCYTSAYDYTPDPKKDLLDYNLEQQADMVADNYLSKQRRAHPDPPLPDATPEGLDKSFFGGAQLKMLTQMREKEPTSLQVRTAEASGTVAFDSEGQAHFTKKYADQVNDQRKKDAAAQAQHDADLDKVMAKFNADPSYARNPTLMEKTENLVLRAAVNMAETAAPIMPFALKK